MLVCPYEYVNDQKVCLLWKVCVQFYVVSKFDEQILLEKSLKGFAFSTISPRWDDVSNLNSTSWKIKFCLCYVLYTMVADDMANCYARPSTTDVMT